MTDAKPDGGFSAVTLVVGANEYLSSKDPAASLEETFRTALTDWDYVHIRSVTVTPLGELHGMDDCDYLRGCDAHG